MTSTLTALDLIEYVKQDCFKANIPENRKPEMIKQNALAI